MTLSERQISAIVQALKWVVGAEDLAQIAFEVDLIDTLEETLENDN